jgi:hypothetical protein
MAGSAWLATNADDWHEQSYIVTGLSARPEPPYWVALSYEKWIYFHSPPGVKIGDPMVVRYDDFGRILGTTRNGRFVPRASPPTKVVFFLPAFYTSLFAGIGLWLSRAERPWSAESGDARSVSTSRLAWSRRRAARMSQTHEAGLTTWASMKELSFERRRLIAGAAGLGLMFMFFVLMAFVVPTLDTVVMSVVFQVLLGFPAIFAIRRARRLGRLMRRARALGVEAQQNDASSLRAVDDSLMHLSHLVAQFRPGPVRVAAEEKFACAERASAAWRLLLNREADLESLVGLTRDSRARLSLERSLAKCRESTLDFQSSVEELAAATAELLAASDDDMTAELARLDSAGERMSLLAVSLDEVNGLERASVAD